MNLNELLHKPIVLKIEYPVKCFAVAMLQAVGLLLFAVAADRYGIHGKVGYEAAFRMALIVGFIVPAAMVAWCIRNNPRLSTWLTLVFTHCGLVGILFSLGILLNLSRDFKACPDLAWHFTLGAYVVMIPLTFLLMTGHSKKKAAYEIRGLQRRLGAAKPSNIPFTSDGSGMRNR